MTMIHQTTQSTTYLFSYDNIYSDIYETNYNMGFVFYDEEESNDFAYGDPVHYYEGDFFSPSFNRSKLATTRFANRQIGKKVFQVIVAKA